MNRYEEDHQGLSWISIRSLIKESKINSLYSKHESESSLESSSPSPRHETSITTEWKPNTYINQSVCFSSMHENYCKDFQDTTHSLVEDSPKLSQDIEAMKCYINRRESKYRKLQKIYNKDMLAQREEVASLRSRLQQSEEEVERLTATVELMKQKHIEQLQNLQARHEHKLKKSKLDLETLISDISEKNSIFVTELLRKAHQEEMSKLKDYYEEKIEEMRVEHELELNAKEVEDSNSEFQDQLNVYKKEMESMEKKYSKELSNLKRMLMIQKEENKSLKRVENDEELKMKIKSLEEENENLKDNIEQYQKTIDELSKELSASFRKKKSTSIEDVLEGDLNRLLGQINCYLDASDFASSKDLGETIKSLQSKIELLKSGKISL